MERILVTGATGFVGRHLVQELASAGHSMTLAVRNAQACPPSWRQTPGIKIVVTGPLETSDNLDDALSDVGSVVHLAGLAHVRHGAGSDEPFFLANVVATERLAEAASRRGVSKFVHMSSLAVITPNASSTIVDDDTNEAPTTSYGRSKRRAEPYVSALAPKGIFAISLRPPLVVGADASGNWGSLQRLAMTGLPLPLGSVTNRRSMIGIDTLVRAISHLVGTRFPVELSGSYCIADNESLALPAIVTSLRAGMGLPSRLLPFPPSILATILGVAGRQQMAAGLLGSLEVDSRRFQSTFDFSSEKSLTQSIVESGREYRRLAGVKLTEHER